MSDLLTVKEISSLFKLHPKTVYKWEMEGKIPYYKINGQLRFDNKEIEEFKAKNKYNSLEYSEFLPKVNLSLENYDRILLKGRSALSKKSKRWNYGKKGVFKRRLKTGESWCFWYYEKKGKIKKMTVRGATCREDAILVMEAKVREVFNREHGIEKKIARFKEFAVTYLEKYAKIRKRSWKTDEKFLKAQLTPFFGDMKLSEITPEKVSEFIGKRQKEGVKNSTIHKHLQVLRKMMNLAIDYGYEVEKNPVRSFHFSNEAENQRTRVLSYEEERQLLKAAAPHLEPIIQTALQTGMRLQEILKLRMEDVDLGQDVITIRPENNKTGKMDYIPLPFPLTELLKRLIAENRGRTAFVFNYLDSRTKEFRAVSSIQHAFCNACRRAGIQNLQFRDLRRTFATRLHQSGVDPLIIQRLLRHSSFKISEQVYIQSNLRMMKEAVEKARRGTEKQENLEHIWNTERPGKEETPLSSWISMN